MNYLVEVYNARIHILPFQVINSARENINYDDYTTANKIKLQTRYPNKCQVYKGFKSVDDFICVARNLDIMIGMRLHSLILSSALGVPVISISYDPKVTSFMKEIGQLNRNFSINNFSHYHLISHIKKIFENPIYNRKILLEGVALYRQRMKTIQPILSRFFHNK